ACPADGPAAAMLLRSSIAWQGRTGAEVKAVPFAKDAGPQSVRRADLWIIPPVELPRWAVAGELQPLPERFVNQDSSFAWADLLPLYGEDLLLWRGKAWGLPL